MYPALRKLVVAVKADEMTIACGGIQGKVRHVQAFNLMYWCISDVIYIIIHRSLASIYARCSSRALSPNFSHIECIPNLVNGLLLLIPLGELLSLIAYLAMHLQWPWLWLRIVRSLTHVLYRIYCR